MFNGCIFRCSFILLAQSYSVVIGNSGSLSFVFLCLRFSGYFFPVCVIVLSSCTHFLTNSEEHFDDN